jgi:hypothetical protein
MKLVEADAVGPAAIEEAPPHPTPPRPEHRRVAISFLFTLAVLVGTVVMVYTVFPARHNVVVTDAIAEHRRAAQEWQLVHPGAEELETWALGVLGERVALPPPGAGVAVIGARPIDILNRRAALVRYQIGAPVVAGGAEVTLVVQRARDVPKRRVSKQDDDDQVEGWRVQKWTFVAVGPAATAAAWKPAMGVP